LRSRLRIAVLRRAPRRAFFGVAALAVIVALALAAGPALGQDSAVTDWVQVQGNAAHTGVAAAGPAPPYKEAWRFDPGVAGRFGFSTPVIGGDVAVTVGTHAVFGVDLATGETAWTVDRDFGPPVSAAVGTAGGSSVVVYTEGFGPTPPTEAFPSATPSGGSTSTSAVASSSPSASPSGAAAPQGEPFDSRVQAVDLTTQKPVWAKPVQLEAISRSGVTVDADTAYVGDQGGTVTAIDLAAGDVRWTYDAPGAVSSPIAVSGGIAVLSTEEQVDATPFLVGVHTSDGTEAWRTELPQSQSPGIAQTSIPAIIDGTIYVAMVGDRSVHALALTDGSERWVTQLNSFVSPRSSILVGGDVVFAVDLTGELYELDAVSGERRWDFAINGSAALGAPVLAGGAVLVPTNLGSLVAIEVQSRRLVARSASAGWSGYFASMAVTSDRVVVLKGGRAPGLVAFEHDPDGQLLSEVSPTVLAPGHLVGYYGIAAVPLAVVLLLIGKLLMGRMGPPVLPEQAWTDDDESEDDLEDDDPEDEDEE
jgi:outer membrane protein assembly factor BamB